MSAFAAVQLLQTSLRGMLKCGEKLSEIVPAADSVEAHRADLRSSSHLQGVNRRPMLHDSA